MPKSAPDKQARMVEARERQTAQCLRLYHEGLSRGQIARHLGIDGGTVSSRLAAAGIPPGRPAQPWTEAELSILRPAIEDLTVSVDALAAQLPTRNRCAVWNKLQALRQGAGIYRNKHAAATAAEETTPEGPSWPLPPGAYRDRRGITLAFVSVQQNSQYDRPLRRE